MRTYIVVIAVMALLCGCSSGKVATPETGTPAPNGQAEPKPIAPTTEAKPKGESVQALNDQSFLLAKEAKWAEAEAAARAALALDQASSAAWFNLGRAQLGASKATEALTSLRKASALTTGGNVDVEYNLAKALWLSGDSQGAITQLQAGARRFPNDPDFPKLLAEVKAGGAQGKLWLLVDLDGDGQQESVKESATGIVVSTSQGAVLYQAERSGSAINAVTPLTMPDGTTVVHVEWRACPTYPQNELLWYNPADKQVHNAVKDVCTTYDYDGKGSFTSFYREFPLATGITRRWERGALVKTRSTQVLYGKASVAQIPWVLSAIASSKDGIQDAGTLFATEALYQQFLANTRGGQWEFRRVGEQLPLRLSVKYFAEERGTVTVQTTSVPSNGDQITAFTWPPAR